MTDAGNTFDVHACGVRVKAQWISPPEAVRSPSAPVLVFLHEGLGSITQWWRFPEHLAGAVGLKGLVYDRYGYGRSEALAGTLDPRYLEAEAFDRLPALLEACGITNPILVGHSDGATIALLYGSRYPASPRGIISEAAHVMVEDVTIEGVQRVRAAYRDTSLREQLRRHHGDKVDRMFQQWSGTWMDPAHRYWQMLDHLPAITAPVLAIQGENDEYGTPGQLEAIARGVSGPVETLLLENCGHAPHFQAPDQVLDAMASFIRKTLSTGSVSVDRM